MSVVCGGDTGIIKPLESLTTCKWVLSVFLLPEVQQILLDSPSCLSVTHLVSLRSFLQVFSCHNDIFYLYWYINPSL